MSIASVFVKALREEAGKKAQDLARGHAKDFPDYKDRAGYIRGLERAIEIIERTAKGDPEPEQRKD